MRTLIWIASTLLFGGAACGDDSSSDAGGADGSSSGPTMSTSSTDGSTSVEAGSGDGSATGDPQASSSGGSSGGQGDCEPDGDLLYPLAEGRVWTFEVLSSGCNDPMYPVTVGAIEMVGGREAFLVTTGTVECGLAERHVSQNGQAVDRYDPLNDTWTPLVAEPIEDGALWADGEQRWDAVPEITVPAGTFADWPRVSRSQRPVLERPRTAARPQSRPKRSWAADDVVQDVATTLPLVPHRIESPERLSVLRTQRTHPVHAPETGAVARGDAVVLSAEAKAALAQERGGDEQVSTALVGPAELTEREQAEVEELQARDEKVRRREQAHAARGRPFASAPQYKYETGPDGRRYAVDGSVSIDAAEVEGDVKATLRKMEAVIGAASAAANPSPQDRAVARAARAVALEARAQLTAQAVDHKGTHVDEAPDTTGARPVEESQEYAAATSPIRPRVNPPLRDRLDAYQATGPPSE